MQIQTKVQSLRRANITYSASTDIYDPPLPLIECTGTRAALEEAANEIMQGHLVAIPTETVYGLAADACNSDAVQSIFKAKQRPSDNPLIVHVSSLTMIESFVGQLPDKFVQIASAFWPGPLTLIVPERVTNDDNIRRLAPEVRGSALNRTFAFRFPKHPIARALIHLSDTPLAAPSANLSGRPSPTTAKHVLSDMQGRIPLILDDLDGPAEEGIESTVLDPLQDPPVILRPGSITLEMIRQLSGFEDTIVRRISGNAEVIAPTTPGMKYTHYCPLYSQVVLVLSDWKDAILKDISSNPELKAIGIFRVKDESTPVKQLELNQLTIHDVCAENVRQMHQLLFSTFRSMDEAKVDVIYVQAVPETHEGLALMNRISKASARSI